MFSLQHLSTNRYPLPDREIENEKQRLEHVQILEENSGLHVKNQKLSEEASYAKEPASAATVILKNLAVEVTKLSLHIMQKLKKELQAAREMMNSKIGGNRNFNDGQRTSRGVRLNGRANDVSRVFRGDFESWNLDSDDLKMELQVRNKEKLLLRMPWLRMSFWKMSTRKMLMTPRRGRWLWRMIWQTYGFLLVS
ncbi:Kinesin motor family protein [Abeliophyllum distichum]|uniref:Kinesin motor family protein n=1 Tax=Abeliophyllum distichum TaxID=126358 RepID=A0ABD1PS42_9LAMI